METDATTTNVSDVSLQAKNPAKEEIKVAASNPFDALCDGDSGDDIINSAVEKLKKVSVVSEPGNGKKAKKGKNSQAVKEETKPAFTANKSILKGGNGNYSNHNRGYGQGAAFYRQQNGNGYYQTYQNSGNGNGQRGHYQGRASNNYYNRQQHGTSVQQNGNATRQSGNGLYRANSGKISSRSSNATEDGGSVKSDREQREEEFQRKKKEREEELERKKKQREEEFEQKLKSFKYDPKVEEDKRKFVASSRDTLLAKQAAIDKAEALYRQHRDNKDNKGNLDELKAAINSAVKDKEKYLEDRNEAWEIIKLSEAKKLTLADYEKMKEESKKASQASKAEKREVKSSDFDGMAVVVKKNVEDSLSLNPAVHKPVAKPKLEAEKTEKSKKMKKKAELELTMSFFLPSASNHVQAGNKKNDAAPSLESGGNFPGLRSAFSSRH